MLLEWSFAETSRRLLKAKMARRNALDNAEIKKGNKDSHNKI